MKSSSSLWMGHAESKKIIWLSKELRNGHRQSSKTVQQRQKRRERERDRGEKETYDVATLERRIASVYIAGRRNGGHIYVVCWWSSLPMPAKPRNTCKMS